MNKFTMKLVWHNCYDYPPKEDWNDNLYVTDGKYVHSVKYSKERGWWSRETGDYLPFDLLWEYWWADIEQTVQGETRFRDLIVDDLVGICVDGKISAHSIGIKDGEIYIENK